MLLSGAMPVVMWLWPIFNSPAMNVTVALLPFAALVICLIVGPLREAYRMHREKEQEVNRLREQLAAKNAAPEAAEARRQADGLVRRSESIVSLLRSGEPKHRLDGVQKASSWDGESQRLIYEHFPQEYERFVHNPLRRGLELGPSSQTAFATDNTERMVLYIQLQAEKLKQILEKSQADSGR